MTKYRIALGLDMSYWTNMHTDRLLGNVLKTQEAETWTQIRGTAIFYTTEATRVMEDLLEEGFDMEDFRWINISKE